MRLPGRFFGMTGLAREVSALVGFRFGVLATRLGDELPTGGAFLVVLVRFTVCFSTGVVAATLEGFGFTLGDALDTALDTGDGLETGLGVRFTGIAIPLD